MEPSDSRSSTIQRKILKILTKLELAKFLTKSDNLHFFVNFAIAPRSLSGDPL